MTSTVAGLDDVFSGTSRIRATHEQVRQSLLRFAQRYAAPERTAKNYQIWTKATGGKQVGYFTLHRMYGGFTKAFEHHGIDHNGKQFRLSTDELLAHFEKVWRGRGQAPTLNELRDAKIDGRTIHSEHYVRRFGSYRKFCRAFVEYKRGIIPKSALIPVREQATSKIPERLRFEILTAARFRCQLCGVSPNAGNEVVLHVDHIIPRSLGGSDSSDNLRCLCGPCNRGRSNTCIDLQTECSNEDSDQEDDSAALQEQF